MGRTRISGWLWIAAAAVAAGVHALRVFRSMVSDDAYILFRYARHLVEGHGLIWNRGEPPVEGFTSLLQVLLLAPGALAGEEAIVAWSQVIGVASAVLACVTTAWLAQRVSGGDERAGVLAAFAVALSSPVAAWARGGLETVTFAMLLSLAIATWLGERGRGGLRSRSSVAFFVAALCRPEALGLAGLAAAFDAVEPGRDSGRARRARALVRWWPLAMLLAAWFTWKLIYFGHLVPNTVQAKSGGGWLAVREGLLYTIRFLRLYGVVGLLLAVLPPIVFPGSSTRSLRYLALGMGLLVVPVLVAGGDYQHSYRYLVPAVPLLAAASAAGAVRAWDALAPVAGPRRNTAALIAIGLAALQLALPSLREIRDLPRVLLRPPRLVDREMVDRSDFVITGKALRRIVPEGETIGTIAVGAIGYYSRRPMLDLLGLNDPVIARRPLDLDRHNGWRPGHMRGSADEVLRRRPEFLMLTLRPTAAPGPPGATDRSNYPFVDTLLESAEFNRAYHLESHQLPDGRWLNLYRRS